MLETCIKQLEERRLRRTATRTALLEVLHAAAHPLSSPELVSRCHQAGRRANKTTIYRDLEAMERAGILRRVMVSDRTQYFELTERGHHHHFVCTSCQEIQDIAIDDEGLLRQAKRVGEKLKFAIAEHAVEFYGLCRKCQSRA